MKLILGKEKSICGQYDIFEDMSESFALLQKDETTGIGKLVQNHLQSLRDLLEDYFPDLNDFDYKLICNPFEIDPKLLPHSLQDAFVELSIFNSIQFYFICNQNITIRSC